MGEFISGSANFNSLSAFSALADGLLGLFGLSLAWFGCLGDCWEPHLLLIGRLQMSLGLLAEAVSGAGKRVRPQQTITYLDSCEYTSSDPNEVSPRTSSNTNPLSDRERLRTPKPENRRSQSPKQRWNAAATPT